MTASEPLTLIEVMAKAAHTSMRLRYPRGNIQPWDHLVEMAPDYPEAVGALVEAYRHDMRNVLAALEKEGYVVTLKEPISRNRVIVHFSGVSDPLAAGAPTPQQDRLLSEMAARPGISHPQAVYTPEPPKEVRSITIAPGVTLSRSSIQADHPMHQPPLKEES